MVHAAAVDSSQKAHQAHSQLYSVDTEVLFIQTCKQDDVGLLLQVNTLEPYKDARSCSAAAIQLHPPHAAAIPAHCAVTTHSVSQQLRAVVTDQQLLINVERPADVAQSSNSTLHSSNTQQLHNAAG
jgi:hypothetical protein